MALSRAHALPLLAALALGCNGTPRPPAAQNGSAEPAALPPPAPSWEPLPAEPRDKILAHSLAEILPDDHLRGAELDDELSRTAFAQYMKRLDGGTMFLLQEYADALAVHADRMDDQLRDGDLLLGRLGSALFLDRLEVVEKAVAAQLAVPFDFSVEESLETDPDKRSYAATEADLADRWRRSLKAQVLERVARMERAAKTLAEAKNDSPKVREALARTLAEIPESLEDKQKKARKDLADSYSGRFSRLRKVEPLEPAENFLNAIAAAYGPHTLYLAPAEKENFDIDMSGSLEGIGAILVEDDHYIRVRELVPGGASWRQGDLEPGDLIMAVAQEDGNPIDVADMRINDVVKMIRGRKGTLVTLTVKKPDDRVQFISITRDVIEIEASYARGALLDLGADHAAMGYVQLQSFYGNMRSRRGKTPERSAADDVRKLVEQLAKQEVGGIIIDLRGNGGGLLDAAVDITGLFIETGPVVQTRRSDGDTQVLRDKDPSLVFDGLVVVLVDRFSASASEILAAALQDYGRAVIVGTGPTHGKGTVQVLLDLDRMLGSKGDPLGVLKLTIQQFYGVDGESTQWRGVVPDVVLPDPMSHVESGERFLDHSMPWNSVEPLDFTPWSKASYDLKALAAASQERVAKRPVFAKLAERAAYLEKRSKQTLVPLERKAWMARRERDRKALDEAEPDLEKAKPRFSVKVIDASGKELKGDKSERRGSKAARLAMWRTSMARDPWVEESLHVLADMAAAR